MLPHRIPPILACSFCRVCRRGRGSIDALIVNPFDPEEIAAEAMHQGLAMPLMNAVRAINRCWRGSGRRRRGNFA